MPSTGEKGAAASKTGNSDNTAHLGTIHTETLLSQGAKHLTNMGSGECGKSSSGARRARLCGCPRRHHPQEEHMCSRCGVLMQIQRGPHQKQNLPKHDS